ncbi:MAG TPA: heparinase II/III-family protein, partial [Gillisia sp.]|nr:heparinase II/III-family protein [Gillisia sp.]
LEILIDVGQIAPKYQPGHSHADSLQFLLNYKNKPVIVDTGISTYEKNERRQLERSTSSHNTLSINDQNSSAVWGGFRVAGRAEVEILTDTSVEVRAKHNGYKNLGITHFRKFTLPNGNFRIEDIIESAANNPYEAKGHLHFHPDTEIVIDGSSLIINKELKIEISGVDQIELVGYKLAEGFNKLKAAKKIEYTFKNKATLEFHAEAATK